MSHASDVGARTPDDEDLTTGQLLTRLSEQTSSLVRGELQLAKAEIQQSVRQAGIGAGLFGAAGIVAVYGGGALVATLILLLARWTDAWPAALIVAGLLLAIAGVAARVGRTKVTRATPPLAASQESLQRDVATLKERGRR